MSSENTEWISVSELAKRENVSTQLIYSRIKAGMYDTQEFTRGKMKGHLIKIKK